MEERHRKEMNGLHEKYGSEIKQIKDEMENKIQQILIKIDFEKLGSRLK